MSNPQESFPAPVETNLEPTLSRRGFLKGIVGIATAATVMNNPVAAFAEGLNPTEDLDLEQRLPTSSTTVIAPSPSTKVENAIPAVSNIDQPSTSQGSYFDTAKMATAMTGVNLAINYGAQKFGIHTGNAKFHADEVAGIEKLKRQQRVSKLSLAKLIDAEVSMIGILPAMEEALFRLTPSAIANFLGAKNDNAWQMGILSSGAFAAAHGLETKDGEPVYPIEQFNLGMVAWWQQRNNGYGHAVLTHAINNTPAGVAMLVEYVRCRRQDYSSLEAIDTHEIPPQQAD